MAAVNKTIHVRVVTFDPAQNKMIPVPNAVLRCKNSEWLWDGNLSDGSHTSDADGRAAVVLSFDADNEAKLNPYFVISIPDGSRQLPASAPATRRVSLPEEWETRHAEKRRIKNLADYADPAKPLELVVGLPARLRLSYSDFDPSGLRNPYALPAGSARVYLADYDEFLFIDFLNPDDTMTGFGYDPRSDTIIPVGQDDSYAFFDAWPTAPSAADGLPNTPQAWLDRPGAPVGTLGGGSFERTGPLATDRHGFVLMCDGKLVRRFYPDGRLCETIGLPGSTVTFTAPSGLAVDQYCNLFVSDSTAGVVLMFRLQYLDGGSGSYVFAGVVSVGSAGMFSFPAGLAVVPNRVVDGAELLAVCDMLNARVQIFEITIQAPGKLSNRAGEPFVNLLLAPLTSFGSTGTAAANFATPVGVAADRQRRLYVCDSTQHKVSRWALDPAGTSYSHQVTWEQAGGGAGAGDGAFDTPLGIAVDTVNSYVYVAEMGNQRVQRLDAESGAHLATWLKVYTPALGSPFSPGSVAADARGEVYAADLVNMRVLRATPFAPGGAPIADASAPADVGSPWTPASEAPHMRAPGYVCFGPGGRLWVADTGNNRVMHFDRDGGGALQLGAALTAGLNAPAGIAAAADGSIFVADSGNDRILPFDAALAPQPALGSSGSGDNQLDDPRGIALVQRAEPLLYVADRANNRVQILKRDGSFTGRITAGAGKNLSQPEDVAADESGNLFVADTGNTRIVQFDSSDAFVREIVPQGSFGFLQPCGVTVDDENMLFVTDRAQGRVYRMNTAGEVLGYWDWRALVVEDSAKQQITPELARQQLLSAPARAAIDERGLLAVADTGNDRVRLARTFSELNVTLFDLGEDLPDISCRVVTKVDARAELGLKLNVGDVSIFDESHDFESKPADDFSEDRFRFRKLLGPQDNTNGAIHLAWSVRQIQRWYQHNSRTDDAEHQWGRPGSSRSLDVDLISGDDSYQFLDVNMGSDAPHGRRPDMFDIGTIAHEMTHWVFYKACDPAPPFSLAGMISLGFSHRTTEITSSNRALSEGWAEYADLSFDRYYGSVDRARGMRIAQAGRWLAGISENGQPPFRYLFGGPDSAPLPQFDAVNVALENEGYLSNTLYQIHQALCSPGVQFADAPSFWYRYNVNLSDAQSQRFVDTIWKALRRFQNDPPLTDIDQASRVYFRNLLDQVQTAQADFAQLVQSIYELNNMLMPSIRIFAEGGEPLGEQLELPAGQSRTLIIRVRDASERPLRGYNLLFASGVPAQFALPGGAGPQLRHGRRLAPGAPGMQRATSASGEVNITYTAPANAAGQTQTLRVSYQPDFDTDESFDPPAKGDAQETTLRKLYMYELRAAAKTWAGSGTNFGSEVVKTIQLKVT